MANRIQNYRGTKANMPTLKVAELGFTTDTKELYIGTSSGNISISGSVWYTGTAMSGTTTITGAYSYSACPQVKVGDIYLNTIYGYVYKCTTSGSGTAAKWTYQGSIRGAAGTNASITGGASTIASSNLTASRALISNTSGKVAVSSVTSTELGYLSGVTNKVVSTTTGYNTKIHVSSSTPSMSVGDLWFKIFLPLADIKSIRLFSINDLQKASLSPSKL